MTEKKQMKMWQGLVVIALCAVMLVTCFLPVYRLNGAAIKPIYNEVVNRMLDASPDLADDLIEEFGTDYKAEIQMELQQEINEEAETFEEGIKTYESDQNIRIRSISPIMVMTKSYEGLYGKELAELMGAGKRQEKTEQAVAEEETGNVSTYEMSNEQKSAMGFFILTPKHFMMIKLFLWIAYALAAATIVLMLLGILRKADRKLFWISVATGAGMTVLFGLVRFEKVLFARGITDSLNNLMKEFIDDFLYMMLMEDYLRGIPENMFGKSFLIKISSAFYAPVFRLALIGAIAVIGVSIVFYILAGKAQKAVVAGAGMEIGTGYDDDLVPGYADGYGRNDGWNNNPFGADSNGFAGGDAHMSPFPQEPKPQVKKQPEPVKAVQPAPAAAPPMGQVRCTKGVALGQGYMLPQDKKVIIGKSPQSANLVINNPTISNIHCSIRYNAGTNRYIVKDHSTNGTFVNGIRLQKGVPMEYPAGTVLILANGKDEIRLG